MNNPKTQRTFEKVTQRMKAIFLLRNTQQRQNVFAQHFVTLNSSQNSSNGVLTREMFLNRAFSHDVTEAILVFQNNETAAMLVSQTNPVGVELFSYGNTFFCSHKFA